MSSKETVFISGASGFIALYTVEALLKKNFRVIGSVRSTSKGENLVEKFQKKFPDAELSYEIVEDIGEVCAFDEAFKKHPEVKYVLHTASPFSYGLNKSIDEAYLRPAIQGTQNILKSIKAYAPQVTKVVVTSSFAAIMDLQQDPKTFVHTEDSWNPITLEQARENEVKGYTASKKFAEKAAREFVEQESPNFTVTTVNPPYVMGPQLFEDSLDKENLNTSAEVVHSLLRSKYGDEEVQGPSGLAVDVRDVALLHVLPLINDELEGARLFPVRGSFTVDKLLLYINANFPELKGKIAVGNAERAKKAEETAMKYDISKTLKITGIELISLEQTIVDSVKQILDYRASANN